MHTGRSYAAAKKTYGGGPDTLVIENSLLLIRRLINTIDNLCTCALTTVLCSGGAYRFEGISDRHLFSVLKTNADPTVLPQRCRRLSSSTAAPPAVSGVLCSRRSPPSSRGGAGPPTFPPWTDEQTLMGRGQTHGARR